MLQFLFDSDLPSTLYMLISTNRKHSDGEIAMVGSFERV